MAYRKSPLPIPGLRLLRLTPLILQIAPMVGSAVGTAMLIATTNIGVRYTGICLLIMVCSKSIQRSLLPQLIDRFACYRVSTLVLTFRSRGRPVLSLRPVTRRVSLKRDMKQQAARADSDDLFGVSAAVIALANSIASASHWFTPYL